MHVTCDISKNCHCDILVRSPLQPAWLHDGEAAGKEQHIKRMEAGMERKIEI